MNVRSHSIHHNSVGGQVYYVQFIVRSQRADVWHLVPFYFSFPNDSSSPAFGVKVAVVITFRLLKVLRTSLTANKVKISRSLLCSLQKRHLREVHTTQPHSNTCFVHQLSDLGTKIRGGLTSRPRSWSGSRVAKFMERRPLLAHSRFFCPNPYDQIHLYSLLDYDGRYTH